MKNRTDGRRLAQHIGNDIILLGTIVKKNANGKNIEIKTTDDVQVNVALQEPITDNIEGYIELHGTLQSKSTMLANYYIHFPPETCEHIDIKMYNDLLSIKNVMGNKQWIINENDSGI